MSRAPVVPLGSFNVLRFGIADIEHAKIGPEDRDKYVLHEFLCLAVLISLWKVQQLH